MLQEQVIVENLIQLSLESDGIPFDQFLSQFLLEAGSKHSCGDECCTATMPF